MSASESLRPLPVVFGCHGTALTPPERSLFARVKPFGLILFKRNCEDPNQVRWLIKEFQQAVGSAETAILIDQEGGRVSRLQPPHWPQHPPAHVFGQMYERDPEWGNEAIQCYSRIVAHELRQIGINVNCAPVVDLLFEGATTALGDRAMSRQPAVVAALARTMAETYMGHGVLPVIKHFPGHGRLQTDPHVVLPIINASRAELESDDFMTFELLKDLPLGMNSHAIFSALDPDSPASMSPIIHQDIIRGILGFDGLLFSDDLTMKALRGSPAELANQALAAGTDVVLHCSGDHDEMTQIAAVLEPMNDESWERWVHARAMLTAPATPYNPAADNARLDLLLGGIASSV